MLSHGVRAFGDALDVFSYGCYLAVTFFFYRLFEPVSKTLSALAALSSTLGCVLGLLRVFHHAPDRLDPLVFFGAYCFLIGYLILTSAFLPRVLGALMTLAGVGWLLTATPLGTRAFTSVEVLGIAAEGLLMLRLLTAGVNVARWNERAVAAGNGGP